MKRACRSGAKRQPVPLHSAKNPTHTKSTSGGCYFNANEFVALVLARDVADSYKLEFEIQHVKGPAGASQEPPRVGFFFGYQKQIRPDEYTEHQFLSLGFNDSPPPAGQPNRAELKIESYCFVSTKGRLPNAQRCLAEGRVWPQPAPVAFPGQWRKFVAEVDADGVTLSWANKPGAPVRPQTALSAAELQRLRALHDEQLKLLAPLVGHEHAPLPAWSPRDAVGVWAADADVAIRNVILSSR